MKIGDRVEIIHAALKGHLGVIEDKTKHSLGWTLWTVKLDDIRVSHPKMLPGHRINIHPSYLKMARYCEEIDVNEVL